MINVQGQTNYDVEAAQAEDALIEFAPVYEDAERFFRNPYYLGGILDKYINPMSDSIGHAQIQLTSSNIVYLEFVKRYLGITQEIVSSNTNYVNVYGLDECLALFNNPLFKIGLAQTQIKRESLSHFHHFLNYPGTYTRNSFLKARVSLGSGPLTFNSFREPQALAYIAGWIDTDRAQFRTKQDKYPEIVITSKSNTLARLLKQEYQGNITINKSRSSRWRTTSNEAIQFAYDILPYLYFCKDKVQSWLEYHDDKTINTQIQPTEA